MQYLGGKKRHARALAGIMESHRLPGARFVDLFCGSLSVAAEMSNPRIANDLCAPLISLYRSWRLGWRPERIGSAGYQESRQLDDPTDPMTAFAGFGLSYAGKYFGGFAKNKRGDDYFGAAERSLDRTMAKVEAARPSCADYRVIPIGPGDLVYCDPPYKGTTGYRATGPFDHDAFALACDGWAEQGADVWVSEYQPPSDRFELVWEHAANASQLSTGKHPERLYRWAG